MTLLVHLDSLLAPAAHLLGSLVVYLILDGARVAHQRREALVVVRQVCVLLFEFVVVDQGLGFELELLLVQQVGVCRHFVVMEMCLLAQPWRA